MRTYFSLSDVHGRDKALNRFEEMGFDIYNNDHYIVLVGDYFDRYEDNLEVLQFCEQMINDLKDRFILIKGNHDEFIMDFVSKLDDYAVGSDLNEANFELDRWLRNGGRVTIDQLFGDINGIYTEEKELKKERLKKFLSHVVDYYETEQYIFVHACIDSDRNVDVWNRDFFHKGISINKTIVIGHTTYEYLDNYNLIKKEVNGNEFQIAISKEMTLCPVFDIDNGKGDNIVLLYEHKETH